MKVQLVKGDLTKQYVDAIVTPANSKLPIAEGIDAAVHAAAGPELLEACAKLGGCRTGEAKITKGYDLAADYVIHTVGPVWRGGVIGEKAQLESCYANSMDLAIQYNLDSIAFPLISVGANGYPKKDAITVALSTLLQYKDMDIEISLVLGNSDAFMLANRIMTQLTQTKYLKL